MKASSIECIFAHILYNSISLGLFANQFAHQHAFTPDVRIEDTLLIADNVFEYALEFHTPVWMMNMHMRKAFDAMIWTNFFTNKWI